MPAVSASAAMGARSSCEVADVLHLYGDAFLRKHRMIPSHHKVIRAIASCRTAALGGHRESCSRCGYSRYAYNSCRNRHCPKCQSLAKAQWLADREAELLPVAYFHNVFTVPHELNCLFLASEANQRQMLSLLFQSVAQTLLLFGRNNLGGRIGFTLVLHTWDQQLRPHYHLHGVIAGGALVEDENRWIDAPSEKFLFSVRALSEVFRGKFLEAVQQLAASGRLEFVRKAAHLADPAKWQAFLRPLWRKDWVVYSKRPFGGPKQVLDYLGRYTHRVAISNHRILSVDGGKVCFHYRDRTDGDTRKIATLPAEKFIARFLLHVLPSGFMRIRHFGFLANRRKKQALSRCRQLLGVSATEGQATQKKNIAEWMFDLTGIDITRCPQCGHQPLHQTEIPPMPVCANPFFQHSRAPPCSHVS